MTKPPTKTSGSKSKSRLKSKAKAKSKARGGGKPTTSKTLKPRRSPIRRILYWGAVAGVWAFLGGIGVIAYLAHDLPDIDTAPLPVSTERMEVRAEDGSLVATYGAVYGDWLDYDDLPSLLVEAVIAIEDRRFLDHIGVDARAIGRAAFRNVSAGRISQGASTLTQQLAKNLYLTPERTFRRKAQEVLLTLWLEARLTKQEILSIYMNRIYFGSGTYGVDAASRKFFGHSARHLSLGEASLLAGLVQAPSLYAPSRSTSRAYARMGEVLNAMVREGYVPEGDAAATRLGPPAISAAAGAHNSRYFADWVIESSRTLVAPSHEGLVIYTSLDPHAQASAEAALSGGLANKSTERLVRQGALVALSTDGAVKAMVGGRSYADSQFNRAVKARRQPGSAFKVFVYLAGLEAGLLPAAIMDDSPVTVDGWTPRNYSGRHQGPMTLHAAFASSINTIAVRVSEYAGRESVAEVARRMGIASSLRTHPSLALGSSEVTPLEMTAAYAVIADGGYSLAPYAILEVRDMEGALLYRRRPPKGRRILSEENVVHLTSMMEAVIDNGTGKAARLGRPAAGKSGTSQGFRDAWFMGFTSDLVAGVWVGNDDGSAMKGVTGGGLPARIWARFMTDWHSGMPPRPLHNEASRFEAAQQAEAWPDANSGADTDAADPKEKKKKPSLLERLFGKKRD